MSLCQGRASTPHSRCAQIHTCQCRAARTQGLARVMAAGARDAVPNCECWSECACVHDVRCSPTTLAAAAKASAALHSWRGAPHSVTITGAGGDAAERLMEDKMKSRAGPREGEACSSCCECTREDHKEHAWNAEWRENKDNTCASHAE